MTETTKTQTTARKPSGAAIAGAHPRPKRYPKQLVIMVSAELFERIEADAARNAMSKSEVGRILIEAGYDAADAAASADDVAGLGVGNDGQG
jgi:hypothetical protein